MESYDARVDGLNVVVRFEVEVAMIDIRHAHT